MVMRIKEEIKQWNYNAWTGFIYEASFFVLILTLAIIGIICLCCCISSDGRPDYCYVQNAQHNTYVVYAHIPWRGDKELGVAPTGEAAHELMQKICPVK